ncbi:MAG: HU family DNA-binding protein [Synergistales bacterium]|nr:HU family DNA-binding protein [Synergistales bacterium]
MAKKEAPKTTKKAAPAPAAKKGKAAPGKDSILAKAQAAREAARENAQDSISKDGLLKEVAKKLGIAKDDVQTVVDAFLDAAGQCLAAGAKVSIHGFGIFNTSVMAAREGKNPLTGEPMSIAESTRVTFKAASALKALVKE